MVFLSALIIRLLFFFESIDFPTFNHPVVDSEVYQEMAVDWAHGAAYGDRLFYQPLFYPFILSTIYRIVGVDIGAVRLLQAVLGAFSCLLLYRACREKLSPRVALTAGLLMALYCPLIFFEQQLLAEGWAVFWLCLLCWGFVVALRKDYPALFIGIGLVGAAAVLTRPPLLIYFVLALLGYTVYLSRHVKTRQALIRLGLALVPFFIVMNATARFNQRETGHYGFLPYSSGINLYVGNNPDWKRTVSARPGFEWRDIYQLPRRETGLSDPWKKSAFFKQKVRAYALEHPASFLQGLAEKTVRLFNSRELPRNIDPYVYRSWSYVLSALMWKGMGWGFPFGLIMPLALLGCWGYARRAPFSLTALLLFYPPVIVLFFVSSRYRILLTPALCCFAACGLALLAVWWRERRHIMLGSALLFLLSMSAVSAFPKRFVEERPDYHAEMLRCIGHQALQKGRLQEAAAHLDEALALDPDLTPALTDRAIVAFGLEQVDTAHGYIDQALQVAPNRASLYMNKGLFFMEHEQFTNAIPWFEKAVTLDPELPNAHVYLGLAYLGLEEYEKALMLFKEEQKVQPLHGALDALISAAEQARAGGKAPKWAPRLKRMMKNRNE